MKVFQQIGVVLVVALLFVKSMVAPVLFLDYELRKDFIIQNYCENKDRPELNCDGKCYLAKRIQATQQEDERQATSQFVSKLFSLEFHNSQSLSVTHELCSTETEPSNNFFYQETPVTAVAFQVFHPPIVTS